MKKTKHQQLDKLSIQQREQLFQTYLDTRSKLKTAKKHNVAQKTVRRYMKRDKWLERIARLDQAVQKKTDETRVNRRLRNLKVLDIAIEDIYNQLEAARSVGETVVPIKLLSKLVLSQDILIGRGAGESIDSQQSPEVKQALELLEQLGPDGVRQLSTVLAERLAAVQSRRERPSGLLPDVGSGAYEPLPNGEMKKKVGRTGGKLKQEILAEEAAEAEPDE